MSITRNNGEVTLTFGGVEIKGTLDKELQMSKYIPKVGEGFQFSSASGSWSGNKKAVFVTPLEVIWLDDKGLTQFVVIERTKFRPIPTKADVEREQLNQILSECYVYGTDGKVEGIQNAGFTIPKKVKRSDIADCVWGSSIDVTRHQAEHTTERLCKLLGDLIED